MPKNIIYIAIFVGENIINVCNPIWILLHYSDYLWENYHYKNAKDLSKIKWVILWSREWELAIYRGPYSAVHMWCQPQRWVSRGVYSHLVPGTRQVEAKEWECLGARLWRVSQSGSSLKLLFLLLCKVGTIWGEDSETHKLAWKTQERTGILKAKHNWNSSWRRYNLYDLLYLLWFVFLKAGPYFNKMAELVVALLRAAQKGTRELCSRHCALSHEPTHAMYMAVPSEAPTEPRSVFSVASSNKWSIWISINIKRQKRESNSLTNSNFT